MTAATLAGTAIVTAMGLYVLAMVAHAVEWGSAGRIETAGRIGVALTLVGWLSNLVGCAARGVAAGRAPWGNMFEFTISAAAAIVAVYLWVLWRRQTRWLGLLVTALAAVLLGLAETVFYVDVGPLVPALHSVWFIIHIVAAVIAAAGFNIGALLAVLYLLKSRRERRQAVTDWLAASYLDRLPSAERLDRLSFSLHAVAFPIWTFVIVAGAIWAQYAWGRYWGWDPKETWSFITWLVYAGYLHARLTAGWRGKRAAILALVGVATFWFNFVGVNLLFSGLHSYAK